MARRAIADLYRKYVSLHREYKLLAQEIRLLRKLTLDLDALIPRSVLSPHAVEFIPMSLALPDPQTGNMAIPAHLEADPAEDQPRPADLQDDLHGQ